MHAPKHTVSYSICHLGTNDTHTDEIGLQSAQAGMSQQESWSRALVADSLAVPFTCPCLAWQEEHISRRLDFKQIGDLEY